MWVFYKNMYVKQKKFFFFCCKIDRNFCQYSLPLELSYLFSLSGPLTFSSFLYIIIFIIKRKLKKAEREREREREREASKGKDVVLLT